MFESAAIALFLWVGNYAKFVDIVPLTRKKGCADMVPLSFGDPSHTLSVKSKTDFATAFPLGGRWHDGAG